MYPQHSKADSSPSLPLYWATPRQRRADTWRQCVIQGRPLCTSTIYCSLGQHGRLLRHLRHKVSAFGRGCGRVMGDGGSKGIYCSLRLHLGTLRAVLVVFVGFRAFVRLFDHSFCMRSPSWVHTFAVLSNLVQSQLPQAGKSVAHRFGLPAATGCLYKA